MSLLNSISTRIGLQ